MKTYDETVWKLALANANYILSGGWDKGPDGLYTIAWIYGVTAKQVLKDMKKLEKKAWTAAQKGE